MYEHTNRCDIFQSAYIFSILLNENEVPHIGHGRPELVLRSDGLLARGLGVGRGALFDGAAAADEEGEQGEEAERMMRSSLAAN